MDADLEHRSTEGRPYRSHLHPACFACRARKSKCKTGHASSTCDACRAQGTPCAFPQARAPKQRVSRKSVQSRRKAFSDQGAGSPSHFMPASRTRCLASTSPTLSQRILQPYAAPGPHMEPFEPLEASVITVTAHVQVQPTSESPATIDTIIPLEEGSSHVVCPAIADDDRVFNEYFSNTSYGQSRRMIRSHLSRSDPGDRHARPILFSTVPKRGERETQSRAHAAANCTAIENLISPYQGDLIDLYVIPSCTNAGCRSAT
jgi:hypothetical protein